MTERTIQYVPISQLGRGYAGKIIDSMLSNEAIIYIMRNNEPTAVIISIDDYNAYLMMMNASKRINKKEVNAKLSGSLRQYSAAEKVGGERDYYRKVLGEPHE